MFRWKVGFGLAALATAVLVAPRPAAAQDPTGLTIAVDEFGNSKGLPSGGYMHPDPLVGTPSALTYNLPFPVVAGTLVLTELGQAGTFSDVIYFEPGFTLRFYSDTSDGVDAPADTGLPDAAIGQVKFISEVGPEGQNGAIYTPGPLDPGFAPGAAVTYDIVSDGGFVSDGMAPEPTSLALLLTGGLPMLGFLRRRRA